MDKEEEVINYVKNCDMCDMYDIFDICRKRHNDQMMKDR